MTALRGNKQGKRSPTEQDGAEGIRGAFPTEALGVTLGTPLPAHHAVSGGVLRSTLRPFSPPLSGTDSTQCWSNRSRSSRGLSSPHSPLKETPQQGGHSTGTRGSLRVHAAGLGWGGGGGAGLHVAPSISSEGAWETLMNKSTSSGALASTPGNHMM